MWPREVADAVPLNRFGFEIDVAFECEQQREFLLIRAVLSVHLSVRLRLHFTQYRFSSTDIRSHVAVPQF